MLKSIAMLSVHTSPIARLGGQETGGMNVYVRDISQEFGRQGINVDIYTRSQDPTLPRVEALAHNVRVLQVKAGPEKPYNKNKIYHHLDEFAAGVLVHKQQYDLIFAHYWLSGLVGLRLRKKWNIPVFQMFHTLAALKNMVAQTNAEREPEQRTNCEREIMHRVDRVIAATPVDCCHMVEYYGASCQNISIIPPGVDLDRFTAMNKIDARHHLDIPVDHKMLLFVGRIQRLKGIDVLLRAIARLRRRQARLTENICLAIIGGKPDPDENETHPEMTHLLNLRRELGLEDLVTFLGSKDQNSLVYYYAAAEMVIIPSNYESFGMVAVEAMACGTPVIASNVGGLKFSVEDGFNGYLVPARNADALANRIRLLLKRPILQQQLSEQAQHWAKRFSWTNIAEELIEVFETEIDRYFQRNKHSNLLPDRKNI
ncbi:glycosyltransferase [Anaerolineales bacterium HSG6]|nr:glycosyltransferase [Anaerolineales bacterium HSG6]MDM8531865.1 glycosyltransferase [Anaerolineales bacterium HSG25]